MDTSSQRFAAASHEWSSGTASDRAPPGACPSSVAGARRAATTGDNRYQCCKRARDGRLADCGIACHKQRRRAWRQLVTAFA
jgi:hypothetical protein